MKSKLFRALVGLCALCVIAFGSGCTTAARTIDAATTKIEIQQGKDKGFAVAFPKELQATKLDLSIDPKTGTIKLTADQLKSSSTGIIESAGVAQAQAMAAMSQTLNTALSALMPFLARAAGLPALPVASSEQRVESIAEPEIPDSRPQTLAPVSVTPIAPLDLSALNLGAK